MVVLLMYIVTQKYRKDVRDWDNDRLSDIETIKLAPEIEKLLPLHGADQFGCPLYPIDNAQYYLENKENEGCFKAFLTDYRIEETDDLINQLLEAPNKSVFRFLVDKSGIRNRWREEAENGIKILETLTKKKFKDESTSSHWDWKLKVGSLPSYANYEYEV